MTVVKIILSVILGLIIFLGVLAYLSSDALRSNFLSADFYTESLAENDAYVRFYDAVLIPRTQDQLDEEGRAHFVGGLRIKKEDVAALVKGILPPPELRRQVEAAIQGAVDYLNKEDDPATGEVIQVPQVFIEFRPILGTRTPTPQGVTPVTGTAKPVVTQFLVEQLKSNIEVLPPVEGTLPEKIEALSRQLYNTLDQLQDPQFPIQVPSLAGIPTEARAGVYDGAKAILIAGGLSPPNQYRGLMRPTTRSRKSFSSPTQRTPWSMPSPRPWYPWSSPLSTRALTSSGNVSSIPRAGSTR